MEVFIVVVSIALGREFCNKIENTDLTIQGVTSSIHVYHKLRKLHPEIEKNVEIWRLSDFMEAWNDTDDDRTEIDVSDSFISYINVKWIV